MPIPRSLRPVLLAFAAGCAPLTLALALPGQPTPKAPAALDMRSPASVAQVLDTIIQARFQDDAPVFGLSRVVIVNSHQSVANFTPHNATERSLMVQASSANRDYAIAFLHCAHVPGQVPAELAGRDPVCSLRTNPYNPQTSLTLLDVYQPTLSPKSSQQLSAWEYNSIVAEPYISMRQNFLKVAAAKLPQLRKGKKVETSTGDWIVYLRAIPAAQASCLGCHTTAKKGDTLGVMVYAVRSSINRL